jgi:ribosomal protein S18 acetylase RimI-like enzyme
MAGDAVRLGATDLEALRRLYADGEATGEAPDFFFPSMLAQGVFFGHRESGELVAAAGTHLVAPEESVAAVGNVYTRRDRRGRGLATRATSAVVSELLRQGLRTIALNVERRNATAIRIYERLGFFRYCAFCEGLARRPERRGSATRRRRP